MNNMPIYQAEKDAGLEELLASQASIAGMSCKLITDVPESTAKTIKEHFLSVAERDTGVSKASLDLYPLYTIMVSVGWNKNDDVFDPSEVWIARKTPVDKPFNFEHDPTKIIGHITGSWVVDDDLNIISDDTTQDKLPEHFHVLTSAVIYRHVRSLNSQLETEVAELIEEIQKDIWRVSMECIFKGFDYAVKDTGSQASTKHVIIAREEKSAHLTKHLKIYGGEGVYQNKRIGRLLRNITFSGKGLTRRPANPDSVILNDVEKFAGVFASVNDVFQNQDKEKVDMSETNTVQLEKDLAEAKQTIADLQAKLTQVDQQKYESEIAGLKAQIDAKDKTIAETQKALDESKLSAEASVKKVTEVEAAKADVEKKLQEKEQALADIQAAKVKADRIQSLIANEFTEEEAKTFVEKFATLADEQFTEIVNTVAAKKKKMMMDKEEKKDDSCASTEEDKKGEEAAKATDLTKVEEDKKDATLATDTNQDVEVAEAARAHLQGFLSHLINGKDKE